MPDKLNPGQKHFLNLISRNANEEGWAPVSAPVYPLVAKMPGELVELERVGDEGRGRVRLKPAGQEILNAMEWL